MIAIVFLTLAIINLTVAQEYPLPKNIDVDEILKNDRLTRNYLDCVLEKGKCTQEGEDLKKAIPEALENECAKCNEKHREGIKKVIRHLIKNKPEWWKEFEAKYDPNGKYKTKYKNLLEQEGLE